MSNPSEMSPFNALPPVVVALALFLFGIECMFLAADRGIVGGAAGIGWRIDALRNYAFFGQVIYLMVADGQWRPDYLMRFVTYAFVQGSFTQMIFVCVFLLALGKFVGQVFRPWAILAVFAASAVGGALAYGLILDDPRPLVGGFPAVYGLIGAYTYLLWLMAGAMGASQIGAFRLIAMLMGIQLLFGALFGGANDWVADLGGFATGFLLSFLVSPGGWSRLRARMRSR